MQPVDIRKEIPILVYLWQGNTRKHIIKIHTRPEKKNKQRPRNKNPIPKLEVFIFKTVDEMARRMSENIQPQNGQELLAL